jgi:SAM-dependent methyltransferase
MVELYLSKFEEVARRLTSDARSVLDVGCRDGILKKYLPREVSYAGVDLSPGPNVTRVCNLEQGIPFADASFDAVVALDVLEHVDNIWFAFDEVVRVARRQVMVVLPNSYHFRERLRFLRGREAGKYVLSPDPIRDRHRWLLSYRSARSFCAHQALRHGLTRSESIMVDERRNILRELLVRVLPLNLMAVASFQVFAKPAPKALPAAAPA